jgi:hypothetical protein
LKRKNTEDTIDLLFLEDFVIRKSAKSSDVESKARSDKPTRLKKYSAGKLLKLTKKIALVSRPTT